jgi:hypothetical protein
MARIQVEKLAEGEFRVCVMEDGSRTRHRVTVSADEATRFGAGVSPEALLEESFRFLLEREPKESILSRFALSLIERYFPDYPREIHGRLARRG